MEMGDNSRQKTTKNDKGAIGVSTIVYEFVNVDTYSRYIRVFVSTFTLKPRMDDTYSRYKSAQNDGTFTAHIGFYNRDIRTNDCEVNENERVRQGYWI